jgi:hypothetical protein
VQKVGSPQQAIATVAHIRALTSHGFLKDTKPIAEINVRSPVYETSYRIDRDLRRGVRMMEERAMAEIATSGSNTLYQIENGERVFPCRCGQTHRGQYAQQDYNQHNCFHDGPIIWLEDYEDKAATMRIKEWDFMCLDCGKQFTAGNPWHEHP